MDSSVSGNGPLRSSSASFSKQRSCAERLSISRTVSGFCAKTRTYNGFKDWLEALLVVAIADEVLCCPPSR